MNEDIKTSDLAELDYIAGAKYRDIAEKYGVSINTVKSWKKRYAWCREKGAHKKTEKVAPEKEPERQADTGKKELTEKQALFCIYYVKSFNATRAYQKAYGCSYASAGTNGPKLLENTAIKEEIRKLKTSKLSRANLEPEDIIQKYIDIAFADIGDFVEFGTETVHVDKCEVKRNFVKFRNSAELDCSAISEISTGTVDRIKMHDKFKALEALRNIFADDASDETLSTLEILMEKFNDADQY